MPTSGFFSLLNFAILLDRASHEELLWTGEIVMIDLSGRSPLLDSMLPANRTKIQFSKIADIGSISSTRRLASLQQHETIRNMAVLEILT